jgi:hypothetical protein
MNGTLSYRGDVVFLDTTAPASQGQTAGVLDGKTLGTDDFMYVKIDNRATEATIGQGAVAGVVEGLAIGDRNTTTAIPDDGVVIVQVAGVHKQVWMTATTGIADWIALGDSGSTLGMARPIVGVGVTTLGGPQSMYMVGVILGGTASASRGTVATVGNQVWVRCGDVV